MTLWLAVLYRVLDSERDIDGHREEGGRSRIVDLSSNLHDREFLDVGDGRCSTSEDGSDGVFDRALGLAGQSDGLGDGSHGGNVADLGGSECNPM